MLEIMKKLIKKYREHPEWTMVFFMMVLVIYVIIYTDHPFQVLPISILLAVFLSEALTVWRNKRQEERDRCVYSTHVTITDLTCRFARIYKQDVHLEEKVILSFKDYDNIQPRRSEENIYNLNSYQKNMTEIGKISNCIFFHANGEISKHITLYSSRPLSKKEQEELKKKGWFDMSVFYKDDEPKG